MKALRAKKISLNADENSYDMADQNASINKKMVLIGGSITFRETSPIIHHNSRFSSPKKMRE